MTLELTLQQAREQWQEAGRRCEQALAQASQTTEDHVFEAALAEAVKARREMRVWGWVVAALPQSE